MGRALRSSLWRGVGFFVVLELMLVPAILYWPEFSKHTKQLRAMAPLPVMRELIDTLEVGGIFAYVTGQHFFKGCNTLGVAAAVLLAVGAVAGEAQRGTLEILLARPISRRRILTERFVFGALATVLPVFATTATIPWLLAFVDQSLALGPLMLSATHESALLLVFYSVTFFCSSVSRAPLAIAFAMLAFSIFEFAIYLVERLTDTSVFRLGDVERFLYIQTHGTLDWRSFLPLIAISALAYVAALVAFARRVP